MRGKRIFANRLAMRWLMAMERSTYIAIQQQQQSHSLTCAVNIHFLLSSRRVLLFLQLSLCVCGWMHFVIIWDRLLPRSDVERRGRDSIECAKLQIILCPEASGQSDLWQIKCTSSASEKKDSCRANSRRSFCESELCGEDKLQQGRWREDFILDKIRNLFRQIVMSCR